MINNFCTVGHSADNNGLYAGRVNNNIAGGAHSAVNNAPKSGEAAAFALTRGLKLRSFNQCCRDGAMQDEPRNLFGGLWYEGELAALYADTNLGKSILAVQIGEHVAEMGIPTLYVDLELSDKGIEKRSRDEESGAMHTYPELLNRLTLDFRQFLEANPNADDQGMCLIDNIEAVARMHGIKAVILDNITAICAGVESGDVAVRLVNRLLSLRDQNGWSVLFVAHTPKLDPGMPITCDSMAGSKRVISLVDSAFAMGRVAGDSDLRYIKQTKVRQSECMYSEDNVLVCRLVRKDGMLQFEKVSTAMERSLLREPKDDVASKRRKEVFALREEGYTIRDIAELTGMSKSKIHRMLASDKGDM